MPKAKLGVLIERGGITSVAILGEDAKGREEVLHLYSAIKADLDAFDRAIKRRLGEQGHVGDVKES